MATARHGDAVYELGPCLGRGGFGVCYKALEKLPSTASRAPKQRAVAVKKIDLKMVQAADKEQYLRYEIGLHSRLAHRNVAQLYSTFSYDGSVYFVLEYCAKKSLADIIVRTTTLPLDLAAYYFVQLIHGLQYIHGCSILHRDLKLSNILVDDEDTVKITDFGLSSTITRSYLERHLACGTPNYLSPEVLLRQGHTAKSDIWSCGVVLFTMFGGVPPFQTDELEEIYRNIVTASYTFSDTYHADRHLRDLVQQTLSLDPEERPELEDILGHAFCDYAAAYKSHVDEGESTIGCTRLRHSASVRTLSKSLSNLFTKQRQERLNAEDSDFAACGEEDADNGEKRLSRSITVVDVKLIRTSTLLNFFRCRGSWCRRPTEFCSSWLTWWRDKSETVGLYYQLSHGYNCALYNDNTACLYCRSSDTFYFVNAGAKRRVCHEAKAGGVNKFYDPLARDLVEEFQDVPATSHRQEQLSWVSQGAAPAAGSPSYVFSWSSHRDNTYYVFYLSDDSMQVNFANRFVLRICGKLCYFYQPSRKGFLVETSTLDSWCLQEVNAELVDVLCDIFL